MPLEREENATDVILRHSSLLLSEDKKKRKTALENIRNELFENNECQPEFLDQIYTQIQRNLLKCLSDNSEICREISISLITDILSTLPANDKYLISLMPILAERIGGQEVKEPSEEVRLLSVVLLKNIINKYGSLLIPYLNEIIQILSKTLLDPYPMVKRESCECTSCTAVHLSKQFHMQSETVVKPLLKVISHQHFKVRVAGVKAIGDVILRGNSKSVDDVVGPLAERLFDQSVPVRAAVAQIVGNWFLHLPDRYSYFHKLLPIILTCLMDDMNEVWEVAMDYWKKAGDQYEMENENELKDVKDFIREPPSHYPPTERPNLGCRTLVKNNLSKILPALVKELDDWTPEVRLKSAGLLYQLLLHSESAMTLNLDRILSGLYVAARDEEKNVTTQVEKSAELIGYFVPSHTYCGLILPVLENSPSSNHLFIFAAILRGSPKHELLKELQSIGKLLSTAAICQNIKSDFQGNLLKCCQSVVLVCSETSCEISACLFRILLSLNSLSAESDISKASEELLCKLRDFEKIQTSDEFYQKYIGPVLEELSITAGSWCVYSPERLILEAILNKSAVQCHWDLISDILIKSLKPTNDPEVKIKLFTAISRIFDSKDKVPDSLLSKASLMILIQNAIFPNLEWHAGRTASAVRTAALSCLLCCLNYNKEVVPELVSDKDAFLPTVLSLVEDDSHLSRQLALCIMCQIFENGGEKMNVDGINKAAEVIVKRLDDVNDTVRVTCLQAITVMLSHLPSNYDLSYYRPHILSIYSIALIHLDDPDEKFNTLVLDMLKKIGKLLPGELHEKIMKSKNKFRNEAGCEELLKHLKNVCI
ncbi:dynein axonemal assembly factor 5 isoform X2 [Ischnura elegans]|uniref:dynein axonemal assembly factor 5 isoform X2 n=1 Tax=Ischnura elegans TaxID=197161 RepID=UPI001ED87C3B|nr:dynein axonemal assembly factor 5 isoform X2 [Ischnura elegans]